MPLTAGTRLGSYEVISSLGAGGMGEVYRARDTRLDRSVAIKVLAPNVAGDADSMARFQREAKSISALAHPNICTLYDVGEHAASPFLVMEFVEGDTLAARIARGPLPVEQALAIAIDIARALDHAHRHGIVHRDLKPGNVMLVKGGAGKTGAPQAKLLDFGLAKITAPGGASRPPAELETAMAAALTARGTILGTLQYMAPEQVEGAECDQRADVWAFGCVLYEMLSGKRPFEAKSPAGIMSAILSSAPAPVATLLPAASGPLSFIVHNCLAKDPDARFQSMADVLLSLLAVDAGAFDGGDSVAPARPAAPLIQRPLVLGPLALVAGMLLAAAALSLWLRPSTSPGSTVRLSIPTPDAGPFSLQRNDIAISPDGRQIVFRRLDEGVSHLYVRPLDRFESTLIRGTDGAEGPFFSPDGSRVAFWAASQLKQIALDGGAASVICDAADMRGGAWASDDTVIFAPSLNDGLFRVRATGGTPERVTALEQALRERTHRFPSIVANGRAVVFMAASTDIESFAEAQIVAQPLPTGPRKVLVQGGFAPRVANGRLFYHRGDALVAVPFDEDRLEVTGRPVVVATDVAWSSNFGAAHYGVSRSGTVAYISGGETQPRKKMVWVDRSGTRLGVVHDQARFYNALRLSPDGARILLWDQAANDRLSMYDLARQTLSRLTDRGNVSGDAWTPDGRSAVSVIGNQLVRVPTDGSGGIEVLDGTPSPKIVPDVSPDADTVAYGVAQSGNGWDIWMYLLKTHKSLPWLSTRFNERFPRFSPDGRWVSYESDETGSIEVFVRAVDGGTKIQVSTGGGRAAVWSSGTRELLFRHGNDMYVADLQLDGRGVGAPRRLFTAPGGLSLPAFDITRDGRRFVMLEGEPAPLMTQINLILASPLGGGSRP